MMWAKPTTTFKTETLENGFTFEFGDFLKNAPAFAGTMAYSWRSGVPSKENDDVRAQKLFVNAVVHVTIT